MPLHSSPSEAPQGFGLRQSSGAFGLVKRHVRKRQKTGAVQDAVACFAESIFLRLISIAAKDRRVKPAPHIHRFVVATFLALSGSMLVSFAADWQPAKGPLMTRWARDVSPKNAHPEYPRPQMERLQWHNLNGLWSYAITDKDSAQPAKWDGEILVPFPIESALSGVMKRVYETNQLWYRRTFTIPRGWKGKRVLLNFGAVDWEVKVFVNGTNVGSHQGGYDGFSLDITDALRPAAEQEIVLAVWDPTDFGPRPRGKQVRNPHGIWYTPTSGIWQTVWLEPVNKGHITGLKITPDVDAKQLLLGIQATGTDPGDTVEVVVESDLQTISMTNAVGSKFVVPLKR